MSDSLTPPPGASEPELTPPPTGLTPPPTTPAGPELTPPPGSGAPAAPSTAKTFTFRMTLPDNWARVDVANLADPTAVRRQLQGYVDAGRITGPQADAMAGVFRGLARQLDGLQVPLVAAYAEPSGDGRFGLASLFAGPHAGDFPLGDSADAITVNGAEGKLQRGTLDQPFADGDRVPVFSLQYVLQSPVPPGVLVVTAATPLVEGFDAEAAELRFHEAVQEIIFHPAD